MLALNNTRRHAPPATPKPSRRWRMVLAGGVALLALAGCKIDSRYEVFLTDVVDVANDAAKAVDLNAAFRIELPTVKDCNENKGKIADVIGKYYALTAPPECQKEGFNTFLIFKAKSPLVNGGARELPNNAVAGMAAKKGQDGAALLYAVLDKRRFASLQAEMKSVNSSGSVEIDDIVIDLNNDGKETYRITGAAAFVNSEPKLITDLTVERRAKFEIRPSNVTTAELVRAGHAPLLSAYVNQ